MPEWRYGTAAGFRKPADCHVAALILIVIPHARRGRFRCRIAQCDHDYVYVAVVLLRAARKSPRKFPLERWLDVPGAIRLHIGRIAGVNIQEFRECLVAAGEHRKLPIFLTMATTVGCLLPLVLGGGPLWVGLAWCMIVGLIFTTFFTLFVVPALYAILVETFGVKPIRVASTVGEMPHG